MKEFFWTFIYWGLLYFGLWIMSGKWLAGNNILSWRFGIWFLLGIAAHVIAKEQGKYNR